MRFICYSLFIFIFWEKPNYTDVQTLRLSACVIKLSFSDLHSSSWSGARASQTSTFTHAEKKCVYLLLKSWNNERDQIQPCPAGPEVELLESRCWTEILLLWTDRNCLTSSLDSETSEDSSNGKQVIHCILSQTLSWTLKGDFSCHKYNLFNIYYFHF